MEISLSTQVLLFRDIDQWNSAKDIFLESEGLPRFVIAKALVDNGCFSVAKILKGLTDLEFFNLVFEYMENN